jgi:hypothetical protein
MSGRQLAHESAQRWDRQSASQLDVWSEAQSASELVQKMARQSSARALWGAQWDHTSAVASGQLSATQSGHGTEVQWERRWERKLG